MELFITLTGGPYSSERCIDLGIYLELISTFCKSIVLSLVGYVEWITEFCEALFLFNMAVFQEALT